MEFDEFLQMMAKQMQCTDSPDELIEAFQVFDETKSGFISVAEFRSVMTTLGERLTDDDVDEMIADTGLGGNGYIRYKGILNTSINFIDFFFDRGFYIYGLTRYLYNIVWWIFAEMINLSY